MDHHNRVPSRLNGNPVVAVIPAARADGTWVVVVEQRRGTRSPDYLTARYRPSLGTTWESGHYDLTLPEAITDAMDRAGYAITPAINP